MAPKTVFFVPGLLTSSLMLKDLRARALCDSGSNIYKGFSLNSTRHLAIQVHGGLFWVLQGKRGKSEGDGMRSTRFTPPSSFPELGHPRLRVPGEEGRSLGRVSQG